MEIVDSGASGIYLTPEAPKKKVNLYAPAVQVRKASGQPLNSSASYKLDLPGPSKDPPTSGNVMPGFHHNLMGIGEFCGPDCKVLITKTSITIFDNKLKTVITGWRDNNGPK